MPVDNTTAALETLVKRLKGIAVKNDDQFTFRIEIGDRGPSLRFQFVCEETADGHTFVSGRGTTVEEAVNAAAAQVTAACGDWNYDFDDVPEVPFVKPPPDKQVLVELSRKIDRAWEMAGLARQDGDKLDEARRTEEARKYERELRDIVGQG